MAEDRQEDGHAAGSRQSFSHAFGDAMRRTGLGQVTPGEVPTAGSLLSAVGGVRGLVESILPGLGFLVIYSFTGNLLLAVLAPVGIALVFVVLRLIQRTTMTQAFAGVAGIAISAALAIITGKPEDNFLPGIVINSVSLAVLLISILVRWPLMGVIVGFLTNEGAAWRTNRARRRVFYISTWLWCGLFALRLVVEVPLYLSGEAGVTALGIAKLVLGVPLYAAFLWVTWLLVRAVYAPKGDDRRS